MIPGFAPQTGFMSDVFWSTVVSIYGGVGNITELWTPDGLVLSGANVESWTGKKGNSATNKTTNRFTTRIVESKTCIYTTSADDKALVAPSLSMRSCLAVASIPVSPIVYQTLAAGASGGGEQLVGDADGMTWYNPGATLTHYKNGNSSETLSSTGLTVFESVSTSAAFNSAIRIGGSSVSGRVWLGDILMVLVLPDNSTSVQRTQMLAAINRYLGRF